MTDNKLSETCNVLGGDLHIKLYQLGNNDTLTNREAENLLSDFHPKVERK